MEIRCLKCDSPSIFVLRLSSPNDFKHSPDIAGGSGGLYYFVCPNCLRFTHVAQWT